MESRIVLCEKNLCKLQSINVMGMLGSMCLYTKTSCVHLPLFHSLYSSLFQPYQFSPTDLQTLHRQFRMQGVVSGTSFYIELKLCLLAFSLALSTVSHDFVKSKYVGFFFFSILILSLQHSLLASSKHPILSHQKKLIEPNWKQNLFLFHYPHII